MTLSIVFETQSCTVSECIKCLIIIGLHLSLLVCMLVETSLGERAVGREGPLWGAMWDAVGGAVPGEGS